MHKIGHNNAVTCAGRQAKGETERGWRTAGEALLQGGKNSSRILGYGKQCKQAETGSLPAAPRMSTLEGCTPHQGLSLWFYGVIKVAALIFIPPLVPRCVITPRTKHRQGQHINGLTCRKSCTRALRCSPSCSCTQSRCSAIHT